MTTARLDRTRSGVADAAHALVERIDQLDLTTVPAEGLEKAKDSAVHLAARTSDAGRRAKKAAPDVGHLVKSAAVKTRSATAHSRRRSPGRTVIGALALTVAAAVVGWLILRKRGDGGPGSFERSGPSQYARSNGSGSRRSDQADPSTAQKDPSRH